MILAAFAWFDSGLRPSGRIFFKEYNMKTRIRFGDFELTRLNGGKFELDGEAMSCVVHSNLVKEISDD